MCGELTLVPPQATGEGTHFLIPWLQRAILYDVRIKPRNISTTTGSKDLQMVSLTLRVMSRPDVSHLSEIYRSLGLDYDERVLPSIGNEVLKATVAQVRVHQRLAPVAPRVTLDGAAV
jgi:prohibitin 1